STRITVADTIKTTLVYAAAAVLRQSCRGASIDNRRYAVSCIANAVDTTGHIRRPHDLRRSQFNRLALALVRQYRRAVLNQPGIRVKARQYGHIGVIGFIPYTGAGCRALLDKGITIRFKIAVTTRRFMQHVINIRGLARGDITDTGAAV